MILNFSFSSCRFLSAALALFLIFVVTIPGRTAAAAESRLEVIDFDQNFINLSFGLVYLKEVRRDGIDIEQIVRNRHQLPWQEVKASAVNFGFNSQPTWFRIKLQPDTIQQLKPKLLRFTYPFLDKIQLYFIRNNQIVEQMQIGDKLSFSTRPYDDFSFVVPIDLPNRLETEIIFRVETSTSMHFELQLWDERAYSNFAMHQLSLHAMYYGAVLMALFYNFFLYLSVGDKNYITYCAYVLTLIFFQLAISGIGYQYIWPNSIWFQDKAIAISIGLIFVSLAVFTEQFLALSSAKEWHQISIKVVIAIGLIYVPVAILLPARITVPLYAATTSLATIYSLVLGITRWRMGYEPAKFYTIAFLSFMAGSFMMALTRFGIMEANFISINGQQLGSLAEVALLSFGLGFRIRLLQIEQTRLTLKLNSKLEDEVRQRTEQLQESHDNLEKLNAILAKNAETDPLTQVKNRRYFLSHANNALTLSEEHYTPLSIILLDIDKFKKVNDNYGHLTGDVCLIEVAKRIKACLRDQSFFVARYGGEEFVIVLPHTGANLAYHIAESIRRTVENAPIAADSHRLNITISGGISSYNPKEDEKVRLEALLSIADEALYRAKELGRNQICIPKKLQHRVKLHSLSTPLT